MASKTKSTGDLVLLALGTFGLVEAERFRALFPASTEALPAALDALRENGSVQRFGNVYSLATDEVEHAVVSRAVRRIRSPWYLFHALLLAFVAITALPILYLLAQAVWYEVATPKLPFLWLFSLGLLGPTAFVGNVIGVPRAKTQITLLSVLNVHGPVSGQHLLNLVSGSVGTEVLCRALISLKHFGLVERSLEGGETEYQVTAAGRIHLARGLTSHLDVASFAILFLSIGCFSVFGLETRPAIQATSAAAGMLTLVVCCEYWRYRLEVDWIFGRFIHKEVASERELARISRRALRSLTSKRFLTTTTADSGSSEQAYRLTDLARFHPWR